MSAAAGVEVAPLSPAEVPAAVGVLARGMRDNPIHMAVFGPDPDRRERLLVRMFTSMWRHMDQDALAARRGGDLGGRHRRHLDSVG